MLLLLLLRWPGAERDHGEGEIDVRLHASPEDEPGVMRCARQRLAQCVLRREVSDPSLLHLGSWNAWVAVPIDCCHGTLDENSAQHGERSILYNTPSISRCHVSKLKLNVKAGLSTELSTQFCQLTQRSQ